MLLLNTVITSVFLIAKPKFYILQYTPKIIIKLGVDDAGKLLLIGLNRLLATYDADKAITEHILHHLAQSLQITISHLQNLIADSLAGAVRQLLQILNGSLVHAHSVGQGSIHAADSTNNIFVQLTSWEFHALQPCRELLIGLEGFRQLRVAIGSKNTQAIELKARCGAVSAALNANLGPQVFVPQDGL